MHGTKEGEWLLGSNVPPSAESMVPTCRESNLASPVSSRPEPARGLQTVHASPVLSASPIQTDRETLTPPNSDTLKNDIKECHAEERVQLGKGNRKCDCCTNLKLKTKQKVRYSTKGCPECNNGEGAFVCEHCWDTFKHDL